MVTWHFLSIRFAGGLGQNPLRQNPLGQNPLGQNPLGHNPRWTKSPRTKS